MTSLHVFGTPDSFLGLISIHLHPESTAGMCIMHIGEKECSEEHVAPVRTLSVRVSRTEASRSMSLLAGPLSCMLFWRLLRMEM